MLCWVNLKKRNDPFPICPRRNTLEFEADQTEKSSPQGQFVLTVGRLQIIAHENTPVSRIVYATAIYYPLLYGSIVSHRRAHCKSPLVLTLTLGRLGSDYIGLVRMTGLEPARSPNRA